MPMWYHSPVETAKLLIFNVILYIRSLAAVERLSENTYDTDFGVHGRRARMIAVKMSFQSVVVCI